MITRTWMKCVAIGVAVSVSSVAVIMAQQAPQGETWEQTMQMTAMGMSLPSQTSVVCQAKSAEPAPPQMEDGCTMTDVRRSGSRMTFNVTCTKPEAMTGTGDFTAEMTTFSGTMTMTSSDGTMVMKMAGKRLGAACDPGGLGRQMAAQQREFDAKKAEMQRASQAEMVKICAEQANAVNPVFFTGAKPSCSDSALLCKNFRTEAGFAKVRGNADMLKMAGDACKVNTTTLQADLCGSALKNESLGFLSSSCPAEAKVLTQRECAGRKFTSDVSAKYQSFCASYFASTLEGDASAPAGTSATPAAPKPADAKGAAVEDAKKRIRGLFGR